MCETTERDVWIITDEREVIKAKEISTTITLRQDRQYRRVSDDAVVSAFGAYDTEEKAKAMALERMRVAVECAEAAVADWTKELQRAEAELADLQERLRKAEAG